MRLEARLYDIDGRLLGVTEPRYTHIRGNKWHEEATFPMLADAECPFWLEILEGEHTVDFVPMLAFSSEEIWRGDQVTTVRDVRITKARKP